jgi:hypothetical protein
MAKIRVKKKLKYKISVVEIQIQLQKKNAYPMFLKSNQVSNNLNRRRASQQNN